MKGKWTYLILLVCLAAFGYLFVLNPTQVPFRLFRGAPVKTNLALIVFLAFLSGFGLAFVSGLGKETALSLRFWWGRRADERREKGRSLSLAGRGLLAVEKPGAAARALRKAYRRLPGDPAVAVDLARAEAAQGKTDAAEQRLKALVEDDPANAEALAVLLDLQQRRGDTQGQRATLAKKLEADPKHLPSLGALRDLYRGAGRWEEAVRVQEKVVARTEGRDARAAEKRVLADLLVRWAATLPGDGALAQLKRAVDEDRSFAPAHAALGDAQEVAGDPEGAARTWQRGYEATGQAGLLVKTEELRERQGRGEEMLKLYRKQGKKDVPSALLGTRLLLSLGRAEEALEALEGFEGPAADSAAVQWLKAEAYFRLRSYERSAKTLLGTLGGAGESPALRFLCTACSAPAGRWDVACPACGATDSLQLDLGRAKPEAEAGG